MQVSPDTFDPVVVWTVRRQEVQVVGKEKLGGGYITVIIRGDLSAVASAVEAGKAKIADLGELIAAHVIARPSPAVLALLPKST